MTSPSLNLGSPVSGLASVTATGVDQTTAYPLVIQETAFGTVPFGSGCRLPGPNSNEMTVYNEDPSNTLTVYPAAGDRIGTNAVNAGVSVPAGQAAKFACFDNPQTLPPRTWHEMSTNSGTSLTVGDGSHSVSNTGSILVSGATVSGSGGNATITVTGTAGVTSVVTQGGPFIANGTITSTGTINNAAASLTAHGVVIAAGTAAATVTAAMSNGQLLIGATGADPAPQTVSGDATISSTGSVTVSKVAGNTLSANTGAVMNSGTVQLYNSVTLTGTAAGTVTIAPTTGTSDVIVNLPASGGTVTVAAAPSFVRQRAEVDFKHGATASVITLNSGFVFGTSGGPTSFTAGTVANEIDRLMLLSPDGTKWAVMAVAQGFTV